LVTLGIITALLVPVYLVMVIEPLLVVKVNWAFTTAGNASNSNANHFVRQVILERGTTRLKQLVAPKES
jgi:hypothetical protein